MARPQRPLSADREALLLLAAAEEFVVHGFAEASLNRIIASAGMGKGSFYHYFADKQALYDQLVARLGAHFDAQRAVLDRGALTRENFWTQLDASLRGLGAAGGESAMQRALSRLFHAQRDHDDALGRLRDDLVDGLRAVLGRGRELGAVRTDLPLDLLLELSIGWLFALDRWAADQPPGDSTATAADLSLKALYDVVAVD